MPVFAYRATDAQGRIVDGQIEAKNHEAVIERLHKLAFFPLEIRASESAGEEAGVSLLPAFRRGKRVAFFTGELATLLEAGLPVDRSLAIMEDLTDDRRLAQEIGRIRASVEEGSSLADALAAHPAYFNQLYVNMVRAGESGGALEIVMRRLAGFLEEQQRTRDFIASSLAYPVVVVLFSIMAITLILVLVLPRFAAIFNDMGQMVPLPARVLMAASRFLGATWWMFLAGLAALFLAARAWLATPGGRLWYDRSRLRWPLVGNLSLKLETARFARTLGTLMTGGVPILQAVDIVGATVGNRHVASFLGDIKNGLRRGEGLVTPLRRTGVFPPLFIHMAAVGEETGHLEEMLLKTAGIFEGEVENTTRGLLSILSPVILVFLGVVLGGIVLTILSAIFSVYRISF